MNRLRPLFVIAIILWIFATFYAAASADEPSILDAPSEATTPADAAAVDEAEPTEPQAEAWPRPNPTPPVMPPRLRPIFTPDGDMTSTADMALRLHRLEARMDTVEREKLDEPAVRKVAEDVFRKLYVTIRTPSGQQRLQPVQASTTVYGIALNPGETLVGYTDVMTGRWVSLQSQYHQPTATMRYQGDPWMQVQQRGNEARFRVVPQAVPMMQMGGGSCRTINGRTYCN